ncbi:MAG: hypothetical protein Q8K85_09450 [Hyphomicrobium sp.]|nr:hypothetical protein [Hyphomicrobium sp.]
MRRWLRPLWIFLALLFLLEAWLWDHLEPIVARAVSLIPWARFKLWLARAIADLPPWATLFVFAVPFVAMLPLKFLEVYFLATHNWLGAIAVILGVKLVGLGVTAFIFDVTRDKLLQMAWFRRLYEAMLALRQWAHDITAPVRERVRQLTWLLKPQRASRFLRRLMRLRRRAYQKSAA